MTKRFAQAAGRNAGAILEVLRVEFASCRAVLEIGSGSGQHAVYFSEHLTWLKWQPSDVAQYVDGIKAWVADAETPNLLEPRTIDVRADECPGPEFDAVFSANTAHIMHKDAVAAMFRLVSRTLPPGGSFVLYGPIRQRGRYNTESNAVFDRSLQQRDPGMGLRDIGLLDELATHEKMERLRVYAMPANNHTVVWTKSGEIG
jgi:cyclopropane fatty-acyl-phospholipid synthase-like methyltransferase